MTSKVVSNVISKPLEPHAAVVKPLILRDLGLVCGVLKITPQDNTLM
jgi:hypothetical protein